MSDLVAFDPPLPLLLTLPAVLGCAALALVLGRRAWRARADRAQRRRWGVRAAVAVVLGLMVLGPHVGEEPSTYRTRPDLQLLVALDRTASMAVSDAGGANDSAPAGSRTRIEQATRDIAAITQALDTQATQVALVTWGEQVRVPVPLTSDAFHLARVADATRTERPAENQGSALDRPLGKLWALAQRARAEHPDRVTYLLLLSDGENTRAGDQLPFDDLGDTLDGGLVVGYGTEGGAPIPLDPEDPTSFVPDPDGSGLALSRRGGPNLQAAADELGVDYVPREQLTAADAVAALVPPEEEREGPRVPADVTWLLALVLLGLALVDLRGGWADWLEARRIRLGTGRGAS